MADTKEIKGAVSASELLDAEEKRMILNIIDLGDTRAGEICTPRVDVILAERSESARDVLDRMRGTGYSRLPVCGKDIDDIVGVVYYKDLIGTLLDDALDTPVEKFMHDATFVPETKNVIGLLRQMQTSHNTLAIVVDEYGGCEGVISIEDIVEEIVGEIEDETDSEDVLITQTGDASWRIDGRFPVDDAIALGWPVDESVDYETVAGWLISLSDSVPKIGVSFDEGGYRFTVEKMRRSRISGIKVEKIDESDD